MARARGAMAAGLLALMAALLVLGSLHKRFAYDEADNLAYGRRFLTEGPGAEMRGQRMPVLALNAIPCLPLGCRIRDVDASETARLAVRVPTMLFALATAALAGHWAARLFGPAAGLLALALAALNPNLLAHGKQVTSDVQTTFFTLAFAYALWRLLARFTWPWLLACAAAMVGALVSKFTAMLFVPVAGIVLLGWAVRERPGAAWRRGLARAAAFAALVLFGLNAVYRFDGTFTPLSRLALRSEALSAVAALPLPVPLPRVYAEGIDYSAYLQERPLQNRGANYVLGERYRDGRWYAFPLMILLKTPLALFALVAIAAARRPRLGGRDAALLAALPLALLAAMSLLVDVQIGVRYVLPVVPFLFLLAAPAALAAARWRPAVLALAAWHAASVLSYHPHYMAYFNELIGRRVNAYRYLADSNLDWEDHAYWIARWQARHPDRPLTVSPAGPATGWILVGVNDLVGLFDPERYRWLREGHRPVDHVAYAHLLYYVPPDGRAPPAR